MKGKITCNEKGFTLVELLIYVSIIFVVVAGLYNVLEAGLIIHRNSTSHAIAQMEARRNIERMTKNIRQAVALKETGKNYVTIFYDFDKDDENEDVKYEYNASEGKLYQTVGTTSTKLGEFMINTESEPVFKYYDLSGDQLNPADETTINQTRSIEVHVVVDYPTDDEPDPAPVRLVNRVYLRNFD